MVFVYHHVISVGNMRYNRLRCFVHVKKRGETIAARAVMRMALKVRRAKNQRKNVCICLRIILGFLVGGDLKY